MLRFVLALAAVLLAAPAWAQSFPSKPVRIVVPFPPGAATDVTARLIAQKLSEGWGQSVVIENKPGAGSVLGAETVAKSAADGYTIFMGHIGTHGANPALYGDKLPYDPVKDFAPVTLLVTIPNLLAVHPSLPVRNAKELIDAAKAKPGSINVSSPGVATSAHLIIALFKAQTGVDLVHVPYKGAVAATQALVAGDVQAGFDTVTTLGPQVRSGKVRAIAITTRERSPQAPDVPPLAETVPGFDVATWFAFFVPAGTPPAVIEKIQSDTVRVLRTPEVADKMAGFGMTVVGSSSADLAKHVQSEIARWGKVVKEANIKVE